MAHWKKLATTALVALSLATPFAIMPASGSAFSTDNSDLWWNESESGWGLQIVQRADIVFVTLYVYNASGQPVWYAAVLNYSPSGKWSGDLMQTNGPWFGKQPFDQTAVGVTRVGSLTFTPNSVADGTLSYTINGVSVTKHIQRMTVRYDDYSGDYIGMLAYAAEGCPNPFDRGLFNNRIDFSIVQSGQAMAIVSQQQGTVAVCTSSGSYDQDGQFGNTSQLTGSCTDGSGKGAVTNYYEMNVTPSGISMNFTAPASNPGSKGCMLQGSLVGIRQ
jgi:phage terminase large subunit-like protein